MNALLTSGATSLCAVFKTKTFSVSAVRGDGTTLSLGFPFPFVIKNVGFSTSLAPTDLTLATLLPSKDACLVAGINPKVSQFLHPLPALSILSILSGEK